ncbi:DUF6876 family protein [Calothrix sp. UHCC 0171]|uniref:DUF6876 family protein n=1 Tax=Calothrix sp. UHCC 0171 TaxID=3110245 RepID=UPI002B200E7B|nr:DUF6876 family protein [Calothrix sp. UHCC 0171]MEA5573466.1 hypothetical protein [Calothrix sp. UHCC 0171]
MKTPQQISSELKQFTGSTVLYKHWLGFKYTEGIKYLADETNCYWLLDAIFSHQTKQFLSNPNLREFQIWHLRVENNSGILTCEWDTNQEVLRQEIEYTDFPLDRIKLYLAEEVLILPSEY